MQLATVLVNAFVVGGIGVLLAWYGRERFNDLRGEMRGGFTRLGHRIDRLEDRVTTEFASVRTDLNSVRSELTSVRADVTSVRTDLTQVALAVGGRVRPEHGTG